MAFSEFWDVLEFVDVFWGLFVFFGLFGIFGMFVFLEYLDLHGVVFVEYFELLEILELRQSHNQLCSGIFGICGFWHFLDLSPGKMYLTPPQKVCHWGGTIHIYLSIICTHIEITPYPRPD